METEFIELKRRVEEIKEAKSDMDYVNELRQNVVDLVNRSKQNNVVIHGILEGVEDDSHDCTAYVKAFFDTHMNVADAEVSKFVS